MAPKHYLLLSGCAIGIGGMFGALHTWHEAVSPQFIGGALAVIGAQVAAIFSERP